MFWVSVQAGERTGNFLKINLGQYLYSKQLLVHVKCAWIFIIFRWHIDFFASIN